MSALRSLLSSCRLCLKFRERVIVTRGLGSIVKGTESSQDVESKEIKMSKAMRAYLDRSKKYNEFMQKEEEAYRIGKRHLANMMGADPEAFTQEQVDEAVEYLFPSGLFEKKARPMMKPPSLVFPPKKDAEFDETGRPFHFLFYTGKPNFYNILHETVEHLSKLNELQDKIIRGKVVGDKSTPLDMSDSDWVSKDALERALVEVLSDREYSNFTQALDRLAQHPQASSVREFIYKYRTPLMESSMSFTPTEPEVNVDGRRFVLTKDAPRKSARADVKVIHPGTGMISINGQGIEYFSKMECRNQILFPLELSGLRDSVDVEATVRGGGPTGQAGALRWGISWGLRCFVSPQVMETMRLAGLLTRDYRRRERKKPGQEGARRKFTWKKR